MTQEQLPGGQGYAIPGQNDIHGEKQVVIVCHGFGSSKESPMVQALHKTLPRFGIGVYSFDFPAHGDSPAPPESLRVDYCLEDLAVVERRVRQLAPGASVAFFGSSFGAYLTLLYLAAQPRPGARAFLRSAAVTMPELVSSWVDDRAAEQLNRRGYFVPDHDYIREMRIARTFLAQLEERSVFEAWTPDRATLFMIHGEADSVAPPQAARRFARQFGARLVLVPDGAHNLMGPGELERVLDCAVGFFLRSGMELKEM